MAGREKQKIYEYTKQGKFVEEYKSLTEMFKTHYDKKKRPIFQNKKYWTHLGKVHPLPNGNLLAYKKLGRNTIVVINKIANSSLANVKGGKVIVMYNLRNQIIATFANMTIASKLTNIPVSTIYSSIEKKNKNSKGLKGEYYFYIQNNNSLEFLKTIQEDWDAVKDLDIGRPLVKDVI